MKTKSINGTGHMSVAMLLVLLALSPWPGGCGTEVGNPKKPGPSKVADDGETAGYVLSSQVNEVTAATSEDNGGADRSALSLVRGNIGFLGSRTCTEDSEKVVVAESDDSENTTEHARRIGTVKQTTTGSESLQKTWTDTDGSVKCNAAGNAAKIKFGTFAAGKLAINVTRSRAVTVDLTKLGRTSTLYKKSFKVTGTREMLFEVKSRAANATTLGKTTKSDVTRSLTFTKRDGTTEEIASKIFTDQDSPLVMEDSYEDGALAKRVISKGRVISVQVGDSKIVSDYVGVEYRKGSGCLPVAGEITGNIYREGEQEAATRFVISFTADGATIAVGDNTKEEYVPERCALE